MRIAHFRYAALLAGLAMATVAGCGGSGGTYNPDLTGSGGAVAQPSFAIAETPASQSVAQGSSTTYTVTLTAQNGFATSITPTASGLPAGAKATFSPATLTPTANGAQTTLTVTTAGSGAAGGATPTGTTRITITASGGGVTKTTIASLTVTAAAPPPGSLQGSIQ